MPSPLEKLVGPEVWRVLAKCHELRNLAEYEGELDITEQVVADLISACKAVAAKLDALVPVQPPGRR